MKTGLNRVNSKLDQLATKVNEEPPRPSAICAYVPDLAQASFVGSSKGRTRLTLLSRNRYYRLHVTRM